VLIRGYYSFPIFLFLLPPFIVLFLAFLIPLYEVNIAAYADTDYERRAMNQRASSALEDILNTPEFKVADSQMSLWSRMVDRLFAYLSGRTGWLNTILRWLIYSVLAFVTISIILYLVRRLRRLPSFTAHRDDAPEPQGNESLENMLTQAYNCSQDGNYREAIRYLFLSLLTYLDNVCLITYEAAKTNGEYINEFNKSVGNEAERFASLALLFERKWYGMEESNIQDFQECEEYFHAIRDIGTIES
jgi:hypothetical protein